MSLTHAAVERVCREESGRILATLLRVVRDFELADDALQDAFAKALERWPVDGLPDNPAAWITRAARNRLVDRLRRRQTARLVSFSEIPFAGLSDETARGADPAELAMLARELDSSLEDDRLRLIFTCCHPALNVEAQVALTLRTLGGLTTEAIACAFLLPVP